LIWNKKQAASRAQKILESDLRLFWKRADDGGSSLSRKGSSLPRLLQQRRKKMNTKIYVGNISSQTTESQLKTLFSQAGEVMSVKIVKDHQTGQPRGFAFVEMSTRREAQKAISMLNRRSFMEKELLVKEPRVRRGFRGRRW